MLVWAERVIAADPDDHIAAAPRVWVAAAYASWMAGDIAADRRMRATGRCTSPSGPVAPFHRT